MISLSADLFYRDLSKYPYFYHESTMPSIFIPTHIFFCSAWNQAEIDQMVFWIQKSRMKFCSILPFQFATLGKAQKSNEGGDQDHAMGLNVTLSKPSISLLLPSDCVFPLTKEIDKCSFTYQVKLPWPA